MAQGKWPDRPVRFIVPLAPGGAIDFVARQCGEVMSRQIGQQVIVENRTGAGGTIGMDTVLKADPDGYTILIGNDNAASAPHILRLPHDYTKVLVPIIDIGHQPLVLGVHPSLGVNSVEEYVAKAKKEGAVGFASSGVGSNQHVLGTWLAREAGIRLEHVPYRGAGQAVNDLIAGHVKSALLGPTALIPHHRAILGQAGPDPAGHPDDPGIRLQGPRAGGLVRRLRASGHPGGPGRRDQRRHRQEPHRREAPRCFRAGHHGTDRRFPGAIGRTRAVGFGEVRTACARTRDQGRLTQLKSFGRSRPSVSWPG
jgi:hypothetical protein